MLIMDNIYEKNKYIQPLFEIIGKKSLELTFTIEFAYMELE